MDLSPGSISEPRRLRAGEITRVIEVVSVAEAIATIVAIVCQSQWNTQAQDHQAGSDKAAYGPRGHDSEALPTDELSRTRAPPAATNGRVRAPSAVKTSGPTTTSPHSPRGKAPLAASLHQSPLRATDDRRSIRPLAASHGSAACHAPRT